ncbi:Sec-independent protein translocase protein TatB [Nocardioides sp. TRM66260-LWL]|uniref:sec-independent translocase n=1 Tax=Nocardioides sp. TRM66260-LWL TaxID=2874478 RepID=UPI001CC71819|nr:sec-independent translocase [Nocardioides sp. TRM66260-LWL]MBZ5734193.1 Sec-independent protein translocase protein TatB [Nocardioides sp. TRM66260-LWL]
MFGIGFMELAVIAVVAMVAFGPDRLPEFAKQAAKMLHQVRQMARSARDELRDELGPEYSDLDLRDLDPRQIVRRHIIEAMEEVEAEEAARRSLDGPVLLEGDIPPFDVDAT